MENITYLPQWVKEAILYHIYPLGFLGAPRYAKEEKETVSRLADIRKYYEHLQKLGVNVIQFGPLFESISHGYDTTDYKQIDHRLGNNDLFKRITEELHALGIRVIVDGVFNHVGREFPSFKDIQLNRESSQYVNWHYIDFNGNSPYNDGFDYQNWEGHYDLVKLNLQERKVKDHIFDIAKYWLQDVGIDGWRLDVAYSISPDFWREFRHICKTTKPDCLLIGEMIYEPYTRWIGPELLDAGTGYQIHKSILSSIQSNNMHELKAVLERAFHPAWGLFKETALMNFLGNHDTTRVRSVLRNDRQLISAFLILFTLNGFPKVYYGDEIGMTGVKTGQSDEDLRKPMIEPGDAWPANGELIFENVTRFVRLQKNNHALMYGNLIPVFADNNVISYLRKSSQQTLLIVVNTGLEKTVKTIPLWNLNLDGSVFVDVLNDDHVEHDVKNNQLAMSELQPGWGKVLQKTA
jgi:cyclomaltodextrinase